MILKRHVRLHAIAFLCGLLALLAGCGRDAAVVPERILPEPHMSGDNQAGLYGEVLSNPLRVVVEGPTQRGLLGGKGGRPPAWGQDVLFEVLNPESGATFLQSDAPTFETVTDSSGMALANLRLGDKPGDVVVVARLPEHEEVGEVRLRAVAGLRKIGRDLEGVAGGTIPEFGVQLFDIDGSPAEGVEVFFRAEGHANGADVEVDHAFTDAEGKAVTAWELGDEVQQYFASAEVRDRRPDVAQENRFDLRAIEFKAMATDKRQMLVILFGGLAVFIFGMKNMSDGLQRMADRRLRSILHFMTRNRFMAVGAGALMTAAVQSSSATTVMTVGFVNAGLMTLEQSVGVIFGANIGTTVTAQIIAFKLDALAYPSIAIGLIVMSAARSRQWKSFGTALLGFGLLFLGMQTMSGILKPLRHSPEFISWFQMVDCTPVDGSLMPPIRVLACIAIGTATTVLVQSSSATIGLVLALASQGLISFYTAVPLILGDNIGTTITANLAALGASRNAKRTALAHTLFNCLGALYMYVLFFVPLWNGKPIFLGFVDWITPGEVFAAIPENLLRHVANAHTAFNVANVLLFLPFTPHLARLCQFLVPLGEADKPSVLQYLEPNLLNTPSIALEQAAREVDLMIRKGQKSVNQSCELLSNGGKDLEQKILKREDLIDRLQHEITAYLVDLSQRDLAHSASELIPALVHMVNDAERLGDHAEELIELRRLLDENKLDLTAPAREEIKQFAAGLDRQFETVYELLDESNNVGIEDAVEAARALDVLAQRYTDAHVGRLEQGLVDVQAGVIYLDALAHLERVRDHLLNIAERAYRVSRVTRS